MTKVEPRQLPEEPNMLKPDEAKAHKSKPLLMIANQENMENKKLVDSIMEMIEAQMLTAKTKAEHNVEPL